MELRRLREDDDRATFSSGNDDLDRFFRHYAGQNQFRSHIGTTYVAVEDGRIRGYVTMAPGALEVDKLAAKTKKKLPRYPLPILRIARLAVAGDHQGRGLGKQLLRFALLLALKMRDEFGCTGVVVDAKQEAIAFYNRFGFVALEVLEGQSQARPQPTEMFLSIQEIATALA